MFGAWRLVKLVKSLERLLVLIFPGVSTILDAWLFIHWWKELDAICTKNLPPIMDPRYYKFISHILASVFHFSYGSYSIYSNVKVSSYFKSPIIFRGSVFLFYHDNNYIFTAKFKSILAIMIRVLLHFNWNYIWRLWWQDFSSVEHYI